MFSYTAFSSFQLISHGTIESVAIAVKKHMKANSDTRVLIFSDTTGKEVDLDLSGTDREILEKLKIFAPISVSHTHPTGGVGRPKLGVIAREISLLPQHWEWLANQQGGSSAIIRRLIDEKMKSPEKTAEKIKNAQEVTCRVLTAIAGDLPNYEDALRFLYRKDKKKFFEFLSDWPEDLVEYVKTLSKVVFE